MSWYRQRNAVWSLSLVLVLTHIISERVFRESNTLILVEYIAMLILLCLFVKQLHTSARRYKFLQHLTKALKLVLLAVLLAVPFCLLQGLVISEGPISAFDSIALSLPRVVSDAILNFGNGVLASIVAALYCFFTMKPSVSVTDHLVS